MGAEVAVMAAASVGAKLIGESKALGAAKDAHAQNAALFRDMFGKAEGWLSPWMSRGNTAGDAYMALLGFGDPGAGAAAFDRYLDSTGYKFQLGQGVDALNTNAANRKLLNSGANLKAVSNYGQEMGRQYFDSYLGKLAAPQQYGFSAASALSELAGKFSEMGMNNNNTLANARGASWRGGADAIAKGLSLKTNIDW